MIYDFTSITEIKLIQSFITTCGDFLHRYLQQLNRRTYIAPTDNISDSPKNDLFAKKEKYTFVTEKIQFLNHVIKHGKLKMYEPKLKSIMEWKTLTKVTELKFFFDLVNYY